MEKEHKRQTHTNYVFIAVAASRKSRLHPCMYARHARSRAQRASACACACVRSMCSLMLMYRALPCAPVCALTPRLCMRCVCAVLHVPDDMMYHAPARTHA